jgi:Ca2+:H+ antiporter
MSISPKFLSIKSFLIPVVAWIIFYLRHLSHSPLLIILAFPALIACTLEAVHHAEVIAHRVGQPFGALVLALAVTVIEVSLVISLMLASGQDGSTLARDTVFAAIMIILTGMIGISLLTGAMKFREQSFDLQGINSIITVLLAISVLTLILPNYTKTVSGPYYSERQLIFVSVVSLILYASFIFVQNFKHKELFLSKEERKQNSQHDRPTAKNSFICLGLLIFCLGAVIMLAESLSPDLDDLIDGLHAPHSLAGIIIASIILLPEGISAYKAANRGQLQTSLNLSLGSALASICLTIPTVAIFSIVYHIPLELGLDSKSTVIFILALLVIILSFSVGRTIILQGVVLLMIFATYIFMTVIP